MSNNNDPSVRITQDARIALLEILWKDEEFRSMTKRIIERIFPDYITDAEALRNRLIEILSHEKATE